MRQLNLFRQSFILIALLCGLGIGASAAQAETTGPVWKILSVSNPTNLAPGDETGDDALVVTATNVGGASTGCTKVVIEREELREAKEVLEGKEATHTACHPAYVRKGVGIPGSPVVSPIKISDSLPAGLTATNIYGNDSYKEPLVSSLGEVRGGRVGEKPSGTGGMQCTLEPDPQHCTTDEVVDPGDTLIVTISVDVASGLPPSLPVEATVSGGGAVSESVSEPVTISSASPEYGVAPGGLFAATSTMQAGAHPNVTTAFFLNTSLQARDKGLSIHAGPVGNPKDVRADLPPGLVGTTVGQPVCTMAAVVNEASCPADTMVGTATVIAFSEVGRLEQTVPVFNIAPAPGEPAAFAFNEDLFPVRLDTSVLSDGDYGVRVSATDLTEGAQVIASWITIWGVPADHVGPGPDLAARNLSADQKNETGKLQPLDEVEFGGQGVGQTRVPFLSNPSQCSTPLTAVLETDSWEGAGPGVFASESVSSGTDTGCDELFSFAPSVSMLPDTLEAGAPAGYSFDLSLPQYTEPEGLATPDVKRTAVTLPAGTVISPSAADGLGDCTSEQFYGPLGERGQARPATSGSCPRDAQVGTIRVKTPALEERLKGDVYLGAPECTGVDGTCTPEDAADGNMIHLYAQFSSEGEDGIVIKLEGKGQVNQQTGQITTIFENTPQLPFSELELTLQGGERATLANPRTCGLATTMTELEPWSHEPGPNEAAGTPDATPTSSFEVNENCFGAQFNPSFSAGTTSNQAGGFSPFTLAFGRGDDSEFLNGIQLQMPPGLIGMLSKVKLCGEPQAAEGTCGPESEIGETSVETGPGADPFLVKGGKIYITGPYKGAPYGLSIVVPAKAGPYTLSGTTGKGTVVVRSAISVNPETAALTVTSDPLPTMLDGIPLQLRLVNVTIGPNNNFTFNATSCNKMPIGGTMTSVANATASASSSYQVTNCAALEFKPTFTAATSGKVSKALGASLTAKVSYPPGSLGADANIRSVKVELPKALPSRLTTLQKACTAKQFEENPAACPAASKIGYAVVHTPLLPVPLEGPAIFVSHGGEAFPSLTMVLQGYGITIDLVGSTFISKAGITSTTFKSVPDAPFESFELTLPEGKFSALAANGDPCGQKLVMPTAFVGQNGATFNQNTHIEVQGCSSGISIVSHKVKNHTLTLEVVVPAAGKLTASGKGLKLASKKASARETLTLRLKQPKAGRLHTTVKLHFTPAKGKGLSKSLSVAFKH
jgi:hypothetical protein